MEPMLSFYNDKAVKAKYVSRLKAHHKADEITQGVGFEKNGSTRGCAVGCTLDNYNHKAYETELGIPEGLARLEDEIFEHLPTKDAPKFAVDFLLSIPVGADLSKVKWQFCAFIMRENIERVLLLKMDDKIKEGVVNSIRTILGMHEKAAKGIMPTSAAWSAARSAAESAAESAARSAAWSAAWSAAESAAWSAAESAARSAAGSAAGSAAESAARSAAYQRYAKELLRLLKAAR